MAEPNPRYQDIQDLIGPSHTAFCKTSFGVNCRLLWIFENKSRFSEKELKKEIKPYIMWSKKAQKECAGLGHSFMHTDYIVLVLSVFIYLVIASKMFLHRTGIHTDLVTQGKSANKCWCS